VEPQSTKSDAKNLRGNTFIAVQQMNTHRNQGYQSGKKLLNESVLKDELKQAIGPGQMHTLAH
jgi:hypothetical protein